MANTHSTRSTPIVQPELEHPLDATDEISRINYAFESYHKMLSAYLIRLADQEEPVEDLRRFILGTDVLFYAALARSERLENFINEITRAKSQ